MSLNTNIWRKTAPPRQLSPRLWKTNRKRPRKRPFNLSLANAYLIILSIAKIVMIYENELWMHV